MNHQSSSHWSAKHIGMPWRPHGRDTNGFDCWGLVRRVYGIECNIVLPCLAGDYADPVERAQLDSLAYGTHRDIWREIPAEEIRAFDILLFAGAYLHIGLAVDEGHMLHVDRGRLSQIVRLDGARWNIARAVVGRHVLEPKVTVHE